MKRIRTILALVLAIALVFSGLGAQTAVVQAATNYVTVTKTVSPTTVTTLDEAEVMLSIKASPPVSIIMPNDVILIIDKSGSMNTENKITAAKNAAKSFVDLMDMTKHRVGVVDYSSANMVSSFDLTTDAASAKAYIDKIVAGGSTDTGKAVDVATQMLANHRPEAQPVIVIMTDGAANVGPNGEAGDAIGFQYAKDAAKASKEAGVVFYTIALLNANENPENSAPNLVLKEMATTAQHHHFVLGSVGLAEVYQKIVTEIGRAAAYDVTVTDVVSPEFEIVPGSADNNIPKPEINGNTLTWKFHELKDQELVFKYKIKHKEGTRIGTLPISQGSNITYKDYAGAKINASISSPNLVVKYPAPIITELTLNNGHVNGGEDVVINGQYFRPSPSITFGTISASNIRYISSNQVVVTAPASVQGSVYVSLQNDDKQSAKAEYRYWAIPEITNIAPSSGPLAGGTSVRIDGKYFMRGLKVKFGDQQASSVAYYTGYITTLTPPGLQPGAVDVTLTNPDETSVTVPGGFTYEAPPVPPAPSITSITPNTGFIQGGDLVIIEGKNFTSTTKVYFGGIQANGFYYYNSGKVRVTAPAASQPGPVEVKLVNPDGQETVIPNGYTYMAPPLPPTPEVTSIEPNTGLIAGGYNVIINGTNFASGLKVYFGGVQGTSVYLYNSGSFRVVCPPAAQAGPVDVKIINPDGQSVTVPNGFTYTEPPRIIPAITSVSPASGSTEGGNLVYIDGANFKSGVQVYFGTTPGTGVFLYDSTRLRVNAPAGAAGVVDITVKNSDGESATLSGAYTYVIPQPTVASITPNTGLTAGGYTVTISGTNFRSGVKVYFGTQESSSVFYSSSASIRAQVPAASAGTVDVRIVNPDGTYVVSPAGFTYTEPVIPNPTVTAITPNTGVKTGGTQVYIDGTNFKTTTKVYFGGVLATGLYCYSTNRIRVNTPAVNTAGPVDVKIENTDGGSVTVTGGFTYTEVVEILPKITTITPATGSVKGGYYVYLEGTNLDKATKVYFGGVQAGGFYRYSASKIRVTAPVGTAGPIDVKAVTADGKESNIVTFTYTP